MVPDEGQGLAGDDLQSPVQVPAQVPASRNTSIFPMAKSPHPLEPVLGIAEVRPWLPPHAHPELKGIEAFATPPGI